ncbi:protein translocase subunit SecF [bacterium]|nr:protein translocase subunit SecF [bacterium]
MKMKGKLLGKVLIILVVAVVLGIIDLPPETKSPYVSWAPDYIKNQKVSLGLDLQGGAELDYKIDLRKVPESDKKSIVDGVKEIINRRVNGLGVSEPNIFVSEIAGESHIVVDLAGVNVDEAKGIIGKTIQLEFKEKKDKIDPNEKQKIEEEANDTLQKIKDGADFAVTGKEEEQSNPERVTYSEVDWKFKDEVNKSIADKLFSLSPGEYYDGTIESSGEYSVTPDGQFVEMTGVNIIKLIDKQEVERTVKNKRKVFVSHLLVSYSGAKRADPSITRTKEEAYKRAQEALDKIKSGGDFATIANEYTDDPSNGGTKGGVLTSPAGDGQYADAFESASLALQSKDDLSDIVETGFGYHIIKADNIEPASEETNKEEQIKYAKIFYSTMPSEWKTTGLTGEHFVHADVKFNQVYQPYVSIQFNSEGAKLFTDITERNINKPLAIFVGGDMISAPTVRGKISGGQAQIEGNFSVKEATDLARDLNTGAIPAPIVLAGQYTIGSTLGHDALTKSLGAGILGLIILAIYMILYYRAFGFMAIIALGIYSTILIFLIQSKLSTFVAVIIAVSMFVFLMMKILNNKDNGWEKLLTSVLAVFALFFIVFLLANPIVLTLAGVAGVVLSIGMAVDANILIFERIKEEIKDGRTLGSAIDIGFGRAWTSIRDSNFSSLITCAILFYFGSSIIQGFAFNLAAGILVSMFTAIMITKVLLKTLVGTKIANNAFLIGAKETNKKRRILPIIKNSKIWLGFSGTIIAIAFVSMVVFGLRLGIDFTGGTLMQLKFENEISQEDLKSSLEEIGRELDGTKAAQADSTDTKSPVVEKTPKATTPKGTITKEEAEGTDENSTLTKSVENVDFSNASIISSNEGYIIKSKYISSEAHDAVLAKLKDKFGNFEETRFTTVGPTVGDTMKYKATIALLIAILAIVFYIAFAFRKIPRNISPWRFGISAIIALAHDILFVVGIYAILGFFFKVEIDALFITALLTILGFSVHDTIVVFDRLRENLKNMSREVSFGDVANEALNQTMARSLNTSISTLFTLCALLVLGSSSIFYFVLALVLGTVIGTYSSIFVASPILVIWHNKAMKQKQH